MSLLLQRQWEPHFFGMGGNREKESETSKCKTLKRKNCDITKAPPFQDLFFVAVAFSRLLIFSPSEILLMSFSLLLKRESKVDQQNCF